jgi:hypothetical protein
MAVAMIGPKFYAWDRNGKPLAFGKLYTYQARTNVPKPTYQSEDKIVENTNPAILNGEGYANIYLDGSYKMVLKDKDDNEIWSSDPVSSNSSDEWVGCVTASYVSPTQFKITGNFTSLYSEGRKVRLSDGSTSYSYAKIIESSYASGETTVIVGQSLVSVGLQSACASIVSENSSFNAVDSGDVSGLIFNNENDLAAGIPVYPNVGTIVKIKTRCDGEFLISNGASPDGYGKLDAGNGNTAVLQHNGELKCEWFGATTTMTLTEDRSPNIQAAVNYDIENVRKLTCTSKIYLASQIDWRSGLSARFDGRIIIDEASAPGGIIFNVITTRFTGKGIYVDVCSRHLDGQDLHSYAGDISKTPTCNVLYTTDCRKFKFYGTIIGVKTKPVETGNSGYEYDFSDLHLWGPNIIDMVDYSESDDLHSERFTFGIYSPLFDATLKNNNIVGYHIPSVIGGSWSVENFHPWALWSPMFYGLAVFGQFNKCTGIYPDTISSCARSQAYADANYTLTTGKNILDAGVTTIDESNVRLGAGIYEVPIADRPNDAPGTNVDGNTYNNWHTAFAERTKLDTYGVIVGDDDITSSGPNTDIGNGNLPFQSSNPASINDQRRSRVLYRGAAKFRSDRKELSGVTKRYGVTHVNSGAVDLSRSTNLSQFARYILEEFTGFYGECTITINSDDTTLRALIPNNLFSGSDELSFYFKTNKNLNADTCYITLVAENLQDKVSSYEVTYSYNSDTTVISFESESYRQGILRGSTANRPTTGLTLGLEYTDTTLQKPIWWFNGDWKDATGAIV